MTRDHAVALIEADLAATFRRTDSRLRRIEFLSRLSLPATPVPVGAVAVTRERAGGPSVLRMCVPEFSPSE